MIGRLTGRVVECSPGTVLLDVSGVGYALQIPLGTYYHIHRETEAAVSLHVHTHVREDALLLYGFASRQEREAFEVLIGISGVGPRMALAILSGIGVDELQQTVRQQDRGRLEQIPGVGKKTAERVLLELRDKLERFGTAPAAAAGPTAGGGGGETLRDDAVSALTNLGYTGDRASKAVARALKQLGADATLEALLKAALGGLVR